MTTWPENLADEVRIEVDLIVGEPQAFAGNEARRNYLLLTAQGVEHWHAREQAMLATAGTLLSRAQAAVFSDPAISDQYVRGASRLQAALRKGHPMADGVGAAAREGE